MKEITKVDMNTKNFRTLHDSHSYLDKVHTYLNLFHVISVYICIKTIHLYSFLCDRQLISKTNYSSLCGA